MKLTNEDKELIKMATDLVVANSDIYDEPWMHVGCVIKAKSGNTYKGINIKSSHSICAEQVALGQAYACGEREFDTIVAVKMDADRTTRVVSPCGVCRYIFEIFASTIKVIVADDKGKLSKVNGEELMPYPYIRVKK